MIKLINDDCLKAMDKLIADGVKVDLTVTSPPYDNLRTYNNTLVWNEDIWKNVLDRLFKITKDGGVVVWVVSDATIKGSETGTSFKQALYAKEIGFNLHDTMIWFKDSCRFPDKTRYYDSFEYMFILTKGKIKTFNQICDKKNKWANTKVHGTNRMKDGTTKQLVGHNKKDIKELGARYNVWLKHNTGKKNTLHSATFPQQLARDHIISWSNENDLILDCFMGSGTVGVACKELNRNFIGIELVEDYFKLAENRINNIGSLF